MMNSTESDQGDNSNGISRKEKVNVSPSRYQQCTVVLGLAWWRWVHTQIDLEIQACYEWLGEATTSQLKRRWNPKHVRFSMLLRPCKALSFADNLIPYFVLSFLEIKDSMSVSLYYLCAFFGFTMHPMNSDLQISKAIVSVFSTIVFFVWMDRCKVTFNLSYKEYMHVDLWSVTALFLEVLQTFMLRTLFKSRVVVAWVPYTRLRLVMEAYGETVVHTMAM